MEKVKRWWEGIDRGSFSVGSEDNIYYYKDEEDSKERLSIL